MIIGKNTQTWQKHDDLRKIAGIFAAIASRHNSGFGIGIDMNAGDANGVLHSQSDFFKTNESTTTPEIFESIYKKYNMKILLCERNIENRYKLKLRFPEFEVISNHRKAVNHVLGSKTMPSWGLCIADPNGHSSVKFGIDHMKILGGIIKRLDFLIVFNQRGVSCHIGMENVGDDRYEDETIIQKLGANQINRIKGSRDAVEKYKWMLSDDLDRAGKPLPSLEWLERLGRKHMAVTPLVAASPRFHYRIIILSNYLPDGIKRKYQVMK